MKSKLSWAAGLLMCAGLSFCLTGCSSLESNTVQYIGAPRYPAVDPARVQILQAEPKQPFDRLGEVAINASTDPPPPVDKIEASIRARAAKLGADAAYLVHDQVQTAGVQVWGPWWAPTATPINSRVIVAVAIKFKEH